MHKLVFSVLFVKLEGGGGVYNTYGIQEPPNCAIPSTHQDPVLSQSAEKVQPGEQSKQVVSKTKIIKMLKVQST